MVFSPSSKISARRAQAVAGLILHNAIALGVFALIGLATIPAQAGTVGSTEQENCILTRDNNTTDPACR